MTPSEYTALIFRCQHVFALLSLLINTFLIFLIITKSPPKIGAYKYLMIFISLFEMAYSVLDMVLGPLNFSYRSSFSIVVPTANSLFSPATLRLLNVLYWGFFGSSLAVFAVHFVYRYLAVKGSDFLAVFNSWRIVILFIPTLLSATTWSLISYFICKPNDIMRRFITESVFENFGLKSDEFEFQGLYIYEVSLEDGSMNVRFVDLIGMVLCSFIMSASVLTVMFFGLKCYQSLSVLINRSMSSQSYSKLQSQLFYALVIQTSIPLAVLILPTTVSIFLTISNSKCSFFNGIVSITISFYPVIDPLPTIFIVKSYRNAVFDMLKCRGCFQNRVYYTPPSKAMDQMITQTITNNNGIYSVSHGK